MRWQRGSVVISIVDFTGFETGRPVFRRPRPVLRVLARDDRTGLEGTISTHSLYISRFRVGSRKLEVWTQFGRNFTPRAGAARATAILNQIVRVCR